MARPRKTVNELKLSGTFNQHSSRKSWNTETPFVVERRPAPNHYLQRTKELWNWFFRVKATQGIVSEEDMGALVMMFDAADNYYRMQDELNILQKKPVYSGNLADKEKRAQIKDMVQMQKIFETSFHMWACKFGITHSERTKMLLPSQKKESPLLKLINEA